MVLFLESESATNSHKFGKDIPRWLFYEMLRQAGIDEKQFRELLNK